MSDIDARRYGGHMRLVNALSLSQSGSMSGPKPKPWIAAMSPYVPGKFKSGSDAPVIKLSSNENPLGTSNAATNVLAKPGSAPARYPDPACTTLREAIGALHGLEPERIICGTGSDEILHIAAGAYAGVGDEILYMRYGFSVYPLAAQRVGATPVEVDDADYFADIDAMIDAITPRTRVVFLANPNNPTGTYVSRGDIQRLHAALPHDCLLVLDQAYAEYLTPEDDDGGMALARDNSNVLVTRTFSKIYGLAAERIGWGYAARDIIETLNRIRAPFNVTSTGQETALAALSDQAFVKHSRKHNAQWRSWLQSKIEAMGNAGLRIVPSKANFLLVLFDGPLSAEQAYEGLLERGYITRWLPGQGLPHALRVTIGTEEETRGLAYALSEIVADAL